MKKTDIQAIQGQLNQFNNREDIKNDDDYSNLNHPTFRRMTDDKTDEQLSAIENFMEEHLTEPGGCANKRAINQLQKAGINVRHIPAQYPEDGDQDHVSLTTQHGTVSIQVESDLYR